MLSSTNLYDSHTSNISIACLPRSCNVPAPQTLHQLSGVLVLRTSSIRPIYLRCVPNILPLIAGFLIIAFPIHIKNATYCKLWSLLCLIIDVQGSGNYVPLSIFQKPGITSHISLHSDRPWSCFNCANVLHVIVNLHHEDRQTHHISSPISPFAVEPHATSTLNA